MLPGTRRPNAFAGPHVDRLSLPRKDAAALARTLESPAARLVPVWRSRCLLRREPVASACLLKVSAEWRAEGRAEQLILLGEYRGLALFACELDGAIEPETLNGAEFADLRLAAGLLPHDEAGLLAYARAMVAFQKRHRFCGRCGAPTRFRDAGHVAECSKPECKEQSFPRIDPAVIVLVYHDDKVLLGRQASWPEGRYSTVAGFVEPGESLEDTVRREVKEETGVDVGEMSYHSSQPWPFPSSLMLGYQAQATSTAIHLGDQELEDARWFSRQDIAGGSPLLPFPQSISFRLIEDWYNAGATRPLCEEPGVRRWDR